MKKSISLILAAVCAAQLGGFASAATDQVDLNYNFNGIVHAGEDGSPDAPNGYRSISDRGLNFSVGLPSDPTVDQYRLVDTAGVLDIVHLGNRNTVAGGSWAFDGVADGNDIGIQPTWLADPDQTGTQTTTLATPIAIDHNSSASFLYQISDGGGDFDVRFVFDSGPDVVATIGGGDWFGGLYAGTDSVDRGNLFGAQLHIVEGSIPLNAVAGRTLTSIGFENRSNTNAGYAILAANVAYGGRPEISDPNGWLPIGNEMPGEFPQSVTATNMNVAPVPGSTPDGPGSNDLKVSFPAAGPIAWTEVRHNEGDIGMSIGPFDPNDPSYFPPDAFQEWKPGVDGEPFSNASLSWRVNLNNGALLASVRHNGVDNQDGVGITHGVANFVDDFAQGVAFRMNDGVLENGGNGSSDLIMGIAGTDFGATEASFNVAAAFFPYSEGWLGGWTDEDLPGSQATYTAKAVGVPDNAVNWNLDSSARVALPGVDSATDGMLFVSPSDGSSSTNIAAGAPRDGGWDVAVREDNDIDTSGQNLAFGQSEFQFLYVPYDATGLIGGHVEGSDGSLINSGGDDLFSLTRNSDGEYAVSVFTDDQQTTKRSEDDGMLILSVASHIEGSDPPLADRSFLSYEYDSSTGDFIIQSRELAETNSANTENIYGDWLKQRDSDFYFAWVDFNDPLSIGPAFEADFDGDGDVDGDDFLLWQVGFGANITSGATKMDGDWDNDGDVDGDDFLGWQAEFPSPGSGAGSAAVPEPAAISVALLAALGAVAFARRR